ncbi:MAG TPA: transposase [Polyangiaceae bacterium]
MGDFGVHDARLERSRRPILVFTVLRCCIGATSRQRARSRVAASPRLDQYPAAAAVPITRRDGSRSRRLVDPSYAAAEGRFRHAHDVQSYLGPVPSEATSGGRRRLGAISKQGNCYLRAPSTPPELRFHDGAGRELTVYRFDGHELSERDRASRTVEEFFSSLE